jgi:signal transduction histidine kinase
MKVWRTLYAKIFGWFWLTLIAGALLVLLVTAFSGTQPLGRRWMRVTQDLYAHTAIDFYETGGRQKLSEYLTTLKASSAIDGQLLDDHGQDVLGSPILPHVQRVLQESIKHHRSTFRMGRVWSAATPVEYGGHKFTFVMEVHPLKGFVDGTFALPMLSRFVLALLVAALFCLLLTRHIMAPVRAIQRGALRLAAGDLSTRVFPSIAPRSDELADTARSFDQMADRIQLLLQKRQELLADISHELRSPLTRLSVSLELLHRGETDVLEQMETDIDRLNQMIGQILLLTRMDIQPQILQRERVEFVSILREIGRDADFEGQPDQKSVHVRGLDTCFVAGDAALLWSCFENVIRNALRHTARGTSVDIWVESRANATSFDVFIADHGPGVPETSIPFLCEPFYRISEAREHGSGAGLGLSIARRIIELHDGSIHIQNRTETNGLIVRVSLPAA